MSIRIETEAGLLIAGNVQRADNFFRRLRGWMFREEPAAGEGLLLEPCNGIHTCFMRFAIDVLFLSADDRVLARYDRLGRTRVIPPIAGTAKVLELPGGTLASLQGNVAPGDRLRVLLN